MWKRIALVIATVLLVVGGIGFYLISDPDRMMELFFRPSIPFDQASTPPAPDYSQTSSWLALPELKDPADLVPKGGAGKLEPAPADAFYLHPTTFFTDESWNADLHDARSAEVAAFFVAGQASAFNGCCRVYAPRYRQVTVGALYDIGADNLAALHLAYGDVAKAFCYYLEHHNQGRPFIIASHSQGTMHALRLVEELTAWGASDRLVAAYLAGNRPAVKELESRNLALCKQPTDTGCIVGWDTHDEEGDLNYELPMNHWRGDQIHTSVGVKRLCTNPVSWIHEGTATEKDQHRGAVSLNEPLPFTFMFGREPLGLKISGLGPPQPGIVTARCEAGRAIVRAAPEPYVGMGPSGSLHLYDFELFYMDVRHNAIQRVQAFSAARREATEAEPAPTAD